MGTIGKFSIDYLANKEVFEQEARETTASDFKKKYKISDFLYRKYFFVKSEKKKSAIAYVNLQNRRDAEAKANYQSELLCIADRLRISVNRLKIIAIDFALKELRESENIDG